MNAPPSFRPPPPWWQPLLWAAGLALFGWYFLWAPESFRPRPFSRVGGDYYQEYADALLAGRLDLTRSPDPRLAALPDPYDPRTNGEYRVNDLSYYHGRYYLYHGIVPALVLLAPVRGLTGSHLSLVWAIWVFTLAGTAAAAACALGLRRRYAPSGGGIICIAAMLVLTLGQGSYLVLRTGTTNLLPIAAAYCFIMLAMLAASRVRPGQPGAVAGLLVASLCAGLAVGSRPNYVFASGGLMLVSAWFQLRPAASPRRRLLLLAAALGPITLCLGGQLLLNILRFGHPLEFGMHYMLGNWDQRQLPLLAWSSFTENLRYYLWAPAVFHPVFPYLTAPSWQALGALTTVPFVGLSALLPLVWHRLPDEGRRQLLLPVVVFGANLLVLALLPSGDTASAPTSANARYAFDFLPAWTLLAAGTVMLAAPAAAKRRCMGPVLSFATVGLAGYTLLGAVSLDLGRYPLETIRPLSRFLSWPAWWTGQVRSVEYGPMAIELRFPQGRTGAYEPLLALGDAEAGDLIYVHYESPQTIRISAVGIGRPGPSSQSIPLDYARSHRLVIQAGPLNPPVSHPLLKALDAATVARLSRRLTVSLDGVEVLTAPMSFCAPAGAGLHVGSTPFLREYAAPSFNGTILTHRRLPLALATSAGPAQDEYGPVRLQVQFSTDHPGVAEPLLTTGIPQAGDLVHVTYRQDGCVRFGLDHWGHRGLESDWIPLGPDPVQEVEITLGSLYPPASRPAMADLTPDARADLKERVSIALGGRVILTARQATYDSAPADVVVGLNPFGASSCSYAFSGRILSVSRPRWPRAHP